MGRIDDILNGYKNYFIGGDPVMEAVAVKRAAICAACPLAEKGLHAALLPDRRIRDIQGLYCGECGCPLSAKVRSQGTKCPKNKW